MLSRAGISAAPPQIEFATLMGIFQTRGTEFYIADYQNLGIYACRILVPGMSDIYWAEDLLLANNTMAINLRATPCQLPASRWPQARYLALIEQIDALGLDDFARVRELLDLTIGRDNGWFTLRVGELKTMLALAGGDHEQALLWVESTRDFNASVFSEERDNYYGYLHTLLQFKDEDGRAAASYQNAFARMYGTQTIATTTAALAGENPFYSLTQLDEDLHALPSHQALLAAYEKLQQAKRCFWSAKKSRSRSAAGDGRQSTATRRRNLTLQRVDLSNATLCGRCPAECLAYARHKFEEARRA